jgi:hypothetical protein
MKIFDKALRLMGKYAGLRNMGLLYKEPVEVEYEPVI